MPAEWSRRAVLSRTSALVFAGLAGCTSPMQMESGPVPLRVVNCDDQPRTVAIMITGDHIDSFEQTFTLGREEVRRIPEVFTTTEGPRLVSVVIEVKSGPLTTTQLEAEVGDTVVAILTDDETSRVYAQPEQAFGGYC